jgi:tetratricopeptide (TPR) repeat protein
VQSGPAPRRPGFWPGWLTLWAARAKIKAARHAGAWLKVLEHGEQLLTTAPDDLDTARDMAVAAEQLGLLELAVWLTERGLRTDPRDAVLTRTLAGLLEKRGEFTQAMALWQRLREQDPGDLEAQQKLNDLAARDTIERGNYTRVLARV